MNRRQFLGVATCSSGLLAGCSSRLDSGPRTSPPNDTIFVTPESSSGGTGTEDDPVETIQEALDRAGPGDTIEVGPGTYDEQVVTVRSGEPGQPITIAGPPEAVVRGDDSDWSYGYLIEHSHVHIRGTTVDGRRDPERPSEPSSYVGQGIVTKPAEAHYLRDLVIKPSAVGHVRGAMVNLTLVENVEVGEFKVIGPAGLDDVLTGRNPGFGEIVYVGTVPGSVAEEMPAFEESDVPGGFDRSNGIYIHHIDNSAGHEHSELVDAKLGTHDVTVEYCTDGGGSDTAINLHSYDATVRWCDLRNGRGVGVRVGSSIAAERREAKPRTELLEAERLGGRNNEIYRNRVVGFDELAFMFPETDVGQSPENQRRFCGNEYDGPTVGDPERSCSEDVPRGEGVGHHGGETPWSN